MPELPEVETTCRGLRPWVLQRPVAEVRVLRRQLRWAVPTAVEQQVPGGEFSAIFRRGKYVLLSHSWGTCIVHLGMSGSLRYVPATGELRRHDRVSIVFTDGSSLRLHDPRCFGALLWTEEDWHQHKLLRHLGPEPLAHDFTGAYLYRLSRHRRQGVKGLLMDARVVAGIGNIYANEALFVAGIDPRRPGNSLDQDSYVALVQGVRQVLQKAIAAGGTSLRDFVDGQGQPGYFRQQLQVYQRQGQPCHHCGAPIAQCRLAQRSTFFCPHCQR